MGAGLAGLSYAPSLHWRIDLFRQDSWVFAASLRLAAGFAQTTRRQKI